MPEDTIINYDSELAAKPFTMDGWISNKGQFFHGPGAEHLARYCGSTHRTCKCGAQIRNSLTTCNDCQNKANREAWEKAEIVPWPQDGMVSLGRHGTDQWFSEPEDAYDYADLKGIAPESLMLYAGEPHHLSQVDEDHWIDDLPDEGELPDEVAAALAEFNKVIAASSHVTYYPSNKRVVLTPKSKEATNV